MLDDTDRKILTILQQDADTALAKIAERVGLSQTPCWKRIRKMTELGIIRKKVVLLDREKLGRSLVGFIQIRVPHHTEDWLAAFSKVIVDIPQVIECHRMAGDIDYLLKVSLRDISEYDDLYKRMIRAIDMSDVSVSFSMEQLKETTSLPLY